jgi:hypothetical protein
VSDGVYYLPIATTVVSTLFAWHIFRRWSRKGRPGHLAWWCAGVAMFGAGTFFEGYTALFGWYEWVFRGWYITGALLGAAPLALGTVYLLLPARTANALALALVAYVSIAALFVLLTPLDASLADDKKLAGAVIEWSWVRAFSPLVNSFAFIFLVGGAIASVARYRREGNGTRAWANVWIAIGAILPGIGGSFTRAGYTEVLYVTEFIGILLIAWGYRESVRSSDREATLAPAAQPLPAA